MLLLIGSANSAVSCVTLKTITDSPNQQVGEFSGKTFKIVKVNDYVLPKDSSQIRARFHSGEIHLIGTCNPTHGNFERVGDLLTLSNIGNLGQRACTELFKRPDGNISERTARTPSVITEDKFIALGDISLKLQSNQNEIFFIDKSGNTMIVLGR